MRRRLRSLGAIGVVAVLALATPAAAHGPAAKRLTERQLFKLETRLLGPQHAREHAEERRALRRARRHPVHAARPVARLKATGPADQVGRWDPAMISLPTWAINAVTLPTGKVLFWGRSPLIAGKRGHDSPAYLWNPAVIGPSAIKEVAPPYIDVDLDGDGDLDRAPLFCSGQSLLPSGEILVTGGSLDNPAEIGGSMPGWKGLDRVFTFDPWTRIWREQPKTRHGRWYPTQTLLADGRTIMLAGADETGDTPGGQPSKNPDFEVFTPPAQYGGLGAVTHLAAGDAPWIGFYPHLFVVPGGNVVLAGPTHTDSSRLDLTKLNGPPESAWSAPGQYEVLSHDHTGGNAVLQLLPGLTRIAVIGGLDPLATSGQATNAVETLDNPGATGTWDAQLPQLNYPRSYGNVVQLPDESLLAVGGGAGDQPGGAGVNFTNGEQRLKEVEILKPGASQWALGAAQRKWRAYHSTAVLLPDGRVLSAGDDYWGANDQPNQEGNDPRDVAEVYSPPYLFDGDQPAARPSITAAPRWAKYGDSFTVNAAGPAATKAVLVAPGATTHGNDMSQRVIRLNVLGNAGGVMTLRAPSGPDLAPPGFYMLFVLTADGTPSIARWVQLAASEPPLPPAETPWDDPVPPTTGGGNPPATGGQTPPDMRDRRAPRISVRLLSRRPSHGRLRLRVSLDEPGRVTLQTRLGSRRSTHRLTFKRAGVRTVNIRVRRARGTARLRVTVRARDAAANAASKTVAWRVRRR
jgi:hypothetical protein